MNHNYLSESTKNLSINRDTSHVTCTSITILNNFAWKKGGDFMLENDSQSESPRYRISLENSENYFLIIGTYVI